MLFNSLEFLLFFPTVTTLYFLLPQRYRWFLLLAASCLFYMAFIPAYILILAITILIDYVAGIWIEKAEGTTRTWILIGSIVSTCLVLFIFKYFNFFNASIALASKFLHLHYPVSFIKIILPIGLSFHTFQSLSYVIEVYRRRQKAEHHFGIYALYVMFYPQLVAGPIERPQNLLHQFYEKHVFEYRRVTDGLKLMAWGMFKKVVIADRLAMFVSAVYDKPTEYQGISLITATVFFAFQIYCDFSGYSDIAIGAAQVMGFKLMDNFNRPYFSKSISEFWKRWHISLSSWFRDYLYISLGGNKVSVPRWYLNLTITFLISGLWHGANFTFVLWGALNGFYLIFGILTSTIRKKVCALVGLNAWPTAHKYLKVIITFSLVCFGWIFFRANTIRDAWYIVTHLTNGVAEFMGGLVANVTALRGKNLLSPILLGQEKIDLLIVCLSIAFLIFVHIIQRHGKIRHMLADKPKWLRWSIYYGICISIIFFGVFKEVQFIYFQF